MLGTYPTQEQFKKTPILWWWCKDNKNLLTLSQLN